MCGVARRRCVVLLLWAGMAWAGRPTWAGPSPTTQPAADDGLTVLGTSGLPEHRLTLLTQGDMPFDLPATTQPVAAISHPPAAEPQAIYDPLPPALWSGLSLLVLAGAILSFRRFKTQLR
jgi:hypothetical protein